MNPPTLEPYLFFNGRCEEALHFYRDALGAEIQMLMRFQDSPEPPPPGLLPPDYGAKIMHAALRIGGSMLMASDGCGGEAPFGGFSLSLNLASAAEADRCFSALLEGGRVTMPLGPTFWSPRFGMLVDRFGVGWMIHVVAESPASSPP